MPCCAVEVPGAGFTSSYGGDLLPEAHHRKLRGHSQPWDSVITATHHEFLAACLHMLQRVERKRANCDSSHVPDHSRESWVRLASASLTSTFPFIVSSTRLSCGWSHAHRHPLDNYSHVMQGSVTVQMAASPDRIWTLVSDITNSGRFSPETFESQWLDGATGPAVGVRFRGHVRRNGKWWLVYWTRCTIIKCEPGRDFAFEVMGFGKKPAVAWSYHFESSDGGTLVTETFKLGDSPVYRLYGALASKSRTQTNLDNMQVTLDRIKVVAESPEQSA